MPKTLPVPVLRAMNRLGHDIGNARRRRRIPVRLVAERANISVRTLAKIEKGDPSVAIASYASVIFVLGMTSRLEELVNLRHDSTGLALEEERLPKRIRLPREGAK